MIDCSTGWDGNVWDLSFEELERGIAIATVPSAMTKAHIDYDPLILISWEKARFQLAIDIYSIWKECNGDKTLMKLKLL